MAAVCRVQGGCGAAVCWVQGGCGAAVWRVHVGEGKGWSALGNDGSLFLYVIKEGLTLFDDCVNSLLELSIELKLGLAGLCR